MFRVDIDLRLTPEHLGGLRAGTAKLLSIRQLKCHIDKYVAVQVL
jgi:hypothetical protein